MPRAPRRRAQGRLTPALRRRFTVMLSSLLVVLGAVLLVETALGGGGIGYVFGALLVLAGAGRLYVSTR